MLANVTRSAAVSRRPASMPASSAFSWESCSLACTVAISPMAGLCWLVEGTVLVWSRERVMGAGGLWLTARRGHSRVEQVGCGVQGDCIGDGRAGRVGQQTRHGDERDRY